MDEIPLGAGAAAVADRIRVVDRKLDELEQKVTGYIAQGLRAGGGLNVRQRAEDDDERSRLLADRAALAAQLRALVTEQ